PGGASARRGRAAPGARRTATSSAARLSRSRRSGRDPPCTGAGSGPPRRTESRGARPLPSCRCAPRVKSSFGPGGNLGAEPSWRSGSTRRAGAATASARRRCSTRGGLPYEEVNRDGEAQFRQKLMELTGGWTVPQIVIDGRPIGGYAELYSL